MALEDDIAFFERVPTFALLGKQALRALAIGAEARHLPSGAVLFYAGERADGGYIVQEGALLLEPGTFSEGKEYTAGPGTLVGELALVTETVCSATAIAREPTTVLRVSRNLFRKMLEGYPDAAVNLRDIIVARMDVCMRELGDVQAKLAQSGE